TLKATPENEGIESATSATAIMTDRRPPDRVKSPGDPAAASGDAGADAKTRLATGPDGYIAPCTIPPSGAGTRGARPRRAATTYGARRPRERAARRSPPGADRGARRTARPQTRRDLRASP